MAPNRCMVPNGNTFRIFRIFVTSGRYSTTINSYLLHSLSWIKRWHQRMVVKVCHLLSTAIALMTMTTALSWTYEIIQSQHDMSPEVHCNLCNHCYILGMPDPMPDIRCAQYLSEVHKKVPNEFGQKREPLKSGPDIRDPKHHWISNRYPQPSGRCQKWTQSIIRCQQWIQNIMRCHRDL